MTYPLDRKEGDTLNQRSDGPWIWTRRYDPDVSLRLEQRGLAQISLLGQPCPTPAGRLMAALMRS
jgi:hypothetical protein